MTDVRIAVHSAPVQQLFERAPDTVFFHLRDALGGIFGSHRREWLAQKQVEFGQRGGLQAGRLTSSTSEPAGFAGSRKFFYRVLPASKKRPEGGTLDDITGDAYTRSEIALGLEKGGPASASSTRYLALPIGVTLDSTGRPKSRWVTPSHYRKARATNDLVAFPARRGGPLILWQKKRGKAAARKTGAISRAGEQKTVYLPAYVLVRRVVRKARLKFYDTWDSMAADRDRRYKRAMDQMMRELS